MTRHLTVQSIQDRSWRESRIGWGCRTLSRLFHVEQVLLPIAEIRYWLIPWLDFQPCKINRAAALDWCVEKSRQNHFQLAAHVSWQNTKDDFEMLISDMMPAEYHRRARQVFGEVGFISPFSEDGLVALIGMICRYGATSGGDYMNTVESRWRLFQVLLALQGLYWKLYKLQYSDPARVAQTREEEEEQITYKPRGPSFSFSEGMG